MGHPIEFPATTSDSCRHSREAALTEREFELLYEASHRLDQPYRLEAQFVITAAGRLGFRAGEIAHMRRSWVDMNTQMIHVPRHDPCDKGRDGGVCGYCVRSAEDKAAHGPISREEALQTRWHPKTQNSVRKVPYGFDARTEIVIERFFTEYKRYPRSRLSVNRRVDRVAEECAELDTDAIFPHGLRATAATHHVARGLAPAPLQAMFGWAKMQTAEKYLQTSGDRTDRALRQIYSR
jgi:integrase